jgi:hypothetical protein
VSPTRSGSNRALLVCSKGRAMGCAKGRARGRAPRAKDFQKRTQLKGRFLQMERDRDVTGT